jgi:oligoendopeptidase F
VLVDILCRFYFEQSVFEARKSGELGPEDFCRLMRDAQERTYGDGLAPDARHEYMWAIKSHYYSPHLDFYNFPYAFGQLFGIALYGQFREEGPRFPERYVAMLRKTGSASCEDVCRTLGWDITKSAFWEQGIARFAPKVAAFAEEA